MTTDKQPTTNDYRKRIARPVFVRTFWHGVPDYVDNEANAYGEAVTNAGGEVADIRAYAERDTSGDYPMTYHYRVVTYRAASRIEE